MANEKDQNKKDKKKAPKEIKIDFGKALNKPGQNNKGKGKFNLGWVYGTLILLIFVMTIRGQQGAAEEISYSKFTNEVLPSGDVEDVVVITNQGFVEVSLKKEAIPTWVENGSKDMHAPQLRFKIGSLDTFEETVKEINPELSIKYDTREDYFGTFFWNIIPFILIIGVWILIMRRMSGGMGNSGGPGGIFNVGKSKAKIFDKESNIKVNFNDVAGLAEAKQEIEEIVAFLKNPKKYTELGGKIPKGALLVGPPGTGKTLLAKAVAGEAHVPFFSMSGSDFVEMFVGVGASRVRDLFKQAKEKSPCIIFVNTLNQLLTEMNGFGDNSGVIILAATNRAEILDKALMRAGRFDRQVHVELPELHDRVAIFNVHLKPLKLDDSVDPMFLAKQTPGFSGADIANVCNEAALIAARKEKKMVEKQDFLDAVDRIIGGLEKKSKIITSGEKKAIAFHEAGHATVSWLLEYAHPLVKVTIVPRGKALGAAWYLPEERQLTTQEQMLDEMCATLGGRAAEELVFGKVSTGALNDLERVTKQAYAMVSYFGMSQEIGNVSFYDSQGGGYGFTKPYSEKTSEMIDREAKRIISEQYQRALKLLSDHKEKHEQLANLLVEREVIFTDDMVDIFGERPWKSERMELEEQAHKDYEAQQKARNDARAKEEAKAKKAAAKLAESNEDDAVKSEDKPSESN